MDMPKWSPQNRVIYYKIQVSGDSENNQWNTVIFWERCRATEINQSDVVGLYVH